MLNADMAACRQAAVAQQQQQASAMAAATREAQRVANMRASDAREREQLKVELAKYQPGWLEAASSEDLDGARGSAERAMARLKAIASELGETAPPGGDEANTQALAAIDLVVAREKACRADAKCMSARAAKKAEAQFFAAVVDPMCQADQQREGAIAAMARERSNPSGYVNKVLLHDLGEQQQNAQDQLVALAPYYLKTRHHAWLGWRKECAPPTP